MGFLGESFKAVCALVLIISSVAAAFVWLDPDKAAPNQTVWTIRIVAPAVALLALGMILKLQFRRDLAPDYLGAVFGNVFFNRNGLCFAPTASSVAGVCCFQIHFQNQYDRPSVGIIAFRPAPGLLGLRARIEEIAVEVRCEPGAFGIVKVHIPLANKLQGKQQTFEVGALVEYPEGKGRRLRFRDGIFVRTNINFSQIWSRPPTAKILLPANVAEEIQHVPLVVETRWKLGDPPLIVT